MHEESIAECMCNPLPVSSLGADEWLEAVYASRARWHRQFSSSTGVSVGTAAHLFAAGRALSNARIALSEAVRTYEAAWSCALTLATLRPATPPGSTTPAHSLTTTELIALRSLGTSIVEAYGREGEIFLIALMHHAQRAVIQWLYRAAVLPTRTAPDFSEAATAYMWLSRSVHASMMTRFTAINVALVDEMRACDEHLSAHALSNGLGHAVFDYPISLDLCTTLFTGSFVKDIRRMLAPKDIDRFDAPSGLARFELRAVQMRLLP